MTISLRLADLKIHCAGYARDLNTWLNTIGYCAPNGIYIADFVLDLASGTITGHENLKEAEANRLLCIKCAEIFAEMTAGKAYESPSDMEVLKGVVEDSRKVRYSKDVILR